jgi:hypothetical protein
LGGEFGRLGGRPKKSEAEKRMRTAEGSCKRKREDFAPADKLKMCKAFRQLETDGSTKTAAMSTMMKATDRTKQQINDALKNELKWETAVKASGLHGINRSEAQLPTYLRIRKRKGKQMRAEGAGRKNEVQFLFPAVDVWLTEMRAYGHYVDKTDLVEQFVLLANEYLKRLALKAADVGMSVLEKRRKEMLERRLLGIENKSRAREHLAESIMNKIGAKFHKPQRVTTLTLSEEQARAEATWRAMDRALHDVAFGTEDCKAELFANPAQVEENMKETVLLFSDQVSEQEHTLHLYTRFWCNGFGLNSQEGKTFPPRPCLCKLIFFLQKKNEFALRRSWRKCFAFRGIQAESATPKPGI